MHWTEVDHEPLKAVGIMLLWETLCGYFISICAWDKDHNRTL